MHTAADSLMRRLRAEDSSEGRRPSIHWFDSRSRVGGHKEEMVSSDTYRWIARNSGYRVADIRTNIDWIIVRPCINTTICAGGGTTTSRVIGPAATHLVDRCSCTACDRYSVQAESPQQQNACDCGFFAVLNGERVVEWLAKVLAAPPAASLPPTPPMEEHTFHKGDVGAYRAVAFQAMSEEWMANAGISRDHRMRRAEVTEWKDIPKVIKDYGFK